MNDTQQIPIDEKVAKFMSFLMAIVYRNGGTLEIDNLSEFSHRIMNLGMELNKDSVVLTVSELKPQSN